ncbi:MAG: tripartite tricarboxylate transporter permease [Desulfovibrionaceae bacterium]|nr:tripartite tricarboxylate transporter permease [Desulfovibrionaceae bacterium]
MSAGFDAAALSGMAQGVLAVAGDPLMWGLVLLGCVLGMVVGVLPGFGPPAAMALLFPLVYVLEPLPGITLLAGIFYGAKYGGAVTSILLGVPGEADAVATLFEGHPLAQAGRAKQALAAATLASFTGGMAATLGLAALAPLLGAAALYFGPGQRALLMVGALALVVLLGPGDPRKNLGMVFLGLALALVGLDPVHGAERLTFGSWRLMNGIELTSLLLGVFGLGDILDTLLTPPAPAPLRPVESAGATSLVPKSRTAAENEPVRPSWRLLFPALRGTAIGFATGLVPCGAGMTASFASYALEKRLAPDRARFGRGAWSGLVGPEASNNAAAVASFAPLLLLGLPTNPITAALLGALTVGGVVPGPLLPERQPVFYWGLATSLILGNLLLLFLGLGLARVWAGLARLPYRLLWPFILLLCLTGSYMGAGGPEGPVQCILFGGLSVLLRRRGFAPAPLVLAFVLGPNLETHMVQILMGGL